MKSHSSHLGYIDLGILTFEEMQDAVFGDDYLELLELQALQAFQAAVLTLTAIANDASLNIKQIRFSAKEALKALELSNPSRTH